MRGARRVVALTALLLCAHAGADTVTWTGTAGGDNWSTPGNWSTESVPTAADDVVIPSGTTPVFITVNDVTVNSLTNDRRVEIGPGRTLRVTTAALKNELRLNANATLSGGVYTLSGNGTIAFPATCSFARLNGVTINGNLPNFRGGMKWNNVTLNGTLTAAGAGVTSEIVFEGTQTITGTIASATTGELRLTPSAGGVLTIAAGAAVRGGNISIGTRSQCLGTGPFAFSVVNEGTIDADTADRSITSAAAVTNKGTIKCGPGNLTLANFEDAAGTLTVSGGIMTFAGTFDPTALGTFTRTAGSLVIEGTADLATKTWTPAHEWLNKGTVQNGTLDLTTASLTFPPVCTWGTLSNLTVTGNMPAFSGGMKWNNVTLNGKITAASDAAASEIAFEGTQTLTGTIEATGAAELRFVPTANADLTIAADAIVRGGNIKFLKQSACANSTAFSFGVTNLGKIDPNIAGRAITFGVNLINTGTLNVGPGDVTAATFVGTGGTIAMTAGTLTFTDTFNPANMGTVTRTGGTGIITGTADLASSTWSPQGDWKIKGTVKSGTVDLANGKLTFPATCEFGRLSDVTLNGDLPEFSGGLKWNNVTLNGTITAVGGGVISEINFEGSQTITGNIHANTTGDLRLTPSAASVLTIAPDASLRGGNISLLNRSTCLGVGPFAVSVVNNGSIEANVASRALVVGVPLTNNGILHPIPNAVLSISSAQVTLGPSSTLVIDFKAPPTSVSNFSRVTLTNNAASKLALGGKLKVNYINNYVPLCGVSWDIVSATLLAAGTPVTGTFASFDYGNPGPGRAGKIEYKPKIVTYRLSTGADFNADGFITFEDFDAFIADFEAGLETADFDHDGFITFEDFDAFVTEFESPC